MKKLQAVIKQNKAIFIVLCLSLVVVLSFPFLAGKTVYLPIDSLVSSTPAPTIPVVSPTGKQ